MNSTFTDESFIALVGQKPDQPATLRIVAFDQDNIQRIVYQNDFPNVEHAKSLLPSFGFKPIQWMATKWGRGVMHVSGLDVALIDRQTVA